MKPGNFVIGIDQSYERSVYEVVDLMDRKGVPYLVLLFRAFRHKGHATAFHYKTSYDPDLLIRPAENFRKATEEELAYREMRKSTHRYFRSMRRMFLEGILSASDNRMIVDCVFEERGDETHIVPITVPETPGFRSPLSLQP